MRLLIATLVFVASVGGSMLVEPRILFKAYVNGWFVREELVMALQAATIDQCLLASRHGRPGPQGLCLALNVELLCVRPSTNTPGARCIYVDVRGRRDGRSCMERWGSVALFLYFYFGCMELCVLSQLCLLLGLSMYTIVTPTGLNILVSCLKRYQINPLPLRK